MPDRNCQVFILSAPSQVYGTLHNHHKAFCIGTVIERHARKTGLKDQPDGELAIPEWQKVVYKEEKTKLCIVF